MMTPGRADFTVTVTNFERALNDDVGKRLPCANGPTEVLTDLLVLYKLVLVVDCHRTSSSPIPTDEPKAISNRICFLSHGSVLDGVYDDGYVVAALANAVRAALRSSLETLQHARAVHLDSREQSNLNLPDVRPAFLASQLAIAESEQLLQTVGRLLRA